MKVIHRNNITINQWLCEILTDFGCVNNNSINIGDNCIIIRVDVCAYKINILTAESVTASDSNVLFPIVASLLSSSDLYDPQFTSLKEFINNYIDNKEFIATSDGCVFNINDIFDLPYNFKLLYTNKSYATMI